MGLQVTDVIILALIAAVTGSWLLQLFRWVRLLRTEPERARMLRTGMVFRLLLAVGLALGYPRIYWFVDGLLDVPALPQLLQHLAALAVAHHIQTLVFHMVLPPDRARVATRAWALVLLLAMAGLVTFYLLGPLPNHLPDMASDRARSPFVVQYQMIVVGYAGLAAGSLLWFGARYSRHAARGPLRTALRLVAAGGGLIVLSLVDRFLHLVVIAAGGSLPWRETGVGAAQMFLLGPGLLMFLIGLTMPRWWPELAAWHRRRRWFRQLRPLWLAVYRDDSTIALLPPRPEFLERLTFHRIGFRLHRRVVEIRDALIGPLRTHFDQRVLDRARRLADAEGLAEPESSAVAEAACIAEALRTRERGEQPHATAPGSLSTTATDLDGEATWLAAVSQALHSSPVVAASLQAAGSGAHEHG